MHASPLITTIVAALVLATLIGGLARRIGVSPIAGYLLAGIILGPYSPGFVADQKIASDLSELGIILLMFGVGLHFSFSDLVAVRNIALMGATLQIAVAIALSFVLAWLLDWPVVHCLIFGLALSVASTVVTVRTLQNKRVFENEEGKIATGWLIVQDIIMVLALVLLPPLAGLLTFEIGPVQPHGLEEFAQVFALTIAKIIGFFVFMFLVGRKVIPWILEYAAHTGSREMFRLTVLAIALGVAYGSAILFGVSFALGAFFAGMILAESELSQRAAEESLPLRDAFAVLFFVSVGMLFNPNIIITEPIALVITLLIILVGKSLAAFGFLLFMRRSLEVSAATTASLAQVGEFSFILASLAVSLKMLPTLAHDLILAGAIVSIALNPLIYRLMMAWVSRRKSQPHIDTQGNGDHQPVIEPAHTELTGHAIVIGHGRVGKWITNALLMNKNPVLVIEERLEIVEQLRARNIEAFFGNAADPELLETANISKAQSLFIAMPNVFEAGQVIEAARKVNPTLHIISRAHSDSEVTYLRERGATDVILGEEEIARAMIDYATTESIIVRNKPDIVI
jgi:CPA2 family monovalent cation:H+ antiporter-2